MDGQEVRAKWDRIYRDGATSDSPEPARVLTENAHLLPVSGTALEVACGLGGNALFLAERGLETWACDISAVAIDRLRASARTRGLSIATEVRDVVRQPPEAAAFDVIVVSRFLERSLAGALSTALKPGGLLFYQTFTREKTRTGGPTTPDFLLAPNELLSLFAGLRVVVYREEGRLGDWTQGFRNQALFVGRKMP